MSRADKRRLATGLLLLAALAVFALLHAGCPSPYLTAYRTIATTRAAAASTEQALADVCAEKRRTCLGSHEPTSPGYAACVDGCRKALTAWTQYTRPAVNTALVSAVGAVATAEAIKAKPDLVAILRPVACALSRGMGEWIHLLPVGYRAQVEAAVALVKGFACPP